jgi:hypothetical protein
MNKQREQVILRVAGQSDKTYGIPFLVDYEKESEIVLDNGAMTEELNFKLTLKKVGQVYSAVSGTLFLMDRGPVLPEKPQGAQVDGQEEDELEMLRRRR